MVNNDRPPRTGRTGRDDQTRIWIIVAALVIVAVLIFFFLWPREEVAAPGVDVVAPTVNGDTVDVVAPADDAGTADSGDSADEDNVDVVAPANDGAEEPTGATPPGEARRAPGFSPFVVAGVAVMAA